MSLDRRDFLGRTLAAGSGFLIGCAQSELPMIDMGSDAGFLDAGASDAGFLDAGTLDSGAGAGCSDPFAGGQSLDRLTFVGDERARLETLLNQGWDGRLYTDLSTLESDELIIPNDRFYVRTRYPDLLQPPAVWSIEVTGLATPTILTLDELAPLVRPMGTYVLECSGNGSGGAFGLMSAASWSGIPMTEVLDRIELDPNATRLLVSGFDEHSVPSAGGHSTPGASWIFSFEQLAQTGAFLATHMNGAPLPPDHGEPVRLYVPNWYGCACIKWVNELRLVDEDEASTSQMREFASRTHQRGVPQLARSYLPASMDQAAMPIRVEKWRVDGSIVYRIVGIMWGGYEPTDVLSIRFNGSAPARVDVCPAQETNDTWTLWSHTWRPAARGDYAIRLNIDDPNIVTRRLDSGYYERTARIDEV